MLPGSATVDKLMWRQWFPILSSTCRRILGLLSFIVFSGAQQRERPNGCKWFLRRPELADPVLGLLGLKLKKLSEVAKAEQCVMEPDRREELARFCLKELGLFPQGETPAQAADRFNALDSVERVKVIREIQQAEARARKVREAMKKKKAKEAAAKVMRE